MNNPSISLENLNYHKPTDKKANLKIGVIFDENKKIIKSLKYKESKNNITINNLQLTDKYRIYDLANISISTLKNNNFNNDFTVTKEKNKINISGKKYDATYFFKTINCLSSKHIHISKKIENI